MKNLRIIIFAFTLLVSLVHFAWGGTTNNKKTLDTEMVKLIASAKLGDAKSQTCLAEFYLMGMNVDRDPVKGRSWLQKAANQGNLRAKWTIAALETWEPKNYGSAVKTIQKLADQNYAPAEEQIGQMYLYGNGDKYQQNFTKALNWFHKAANQNYSFAEADIGLAYRHGWGVKPDTAKARIWAIKAANHHIDCAPEVVPLIQRLIAINAIYPKSVLNGLRQGRVIVKMFNHDGKFTYPTVEKSSGYKDIDTAAIKTMAVTPLPPSLGIGGQITLPVNFTQRDIDPVLYSNLETKIHTAIQKATIMPKHILFHGSKGTDKATISFKYFRSHVSNIKIEKSSGDTYEDTAAIAAVKNARYPTTPKEYAGTTMQFSITIDFALP